MLWSGSREHLLHAPTSQIRAANLESVKRTTIFGISFWALFLASAALSARYRWLDTAWLFACILFGIIASVFSVGEMFRNHRVSGEYIYYRGVPRWMRRFLVDDE
jgi:hypothetical protein